MSSILLLSFQILLVANTGLDKLSLAKFVNCIRHKKEHSN